MFPTCNLQLCNIDLPMVNFGFSYWLREEMQKREWTQADLMRHSGMSNAQISRVLNESREPGNDFLRAIARAFKVSPEIVFRAAGVLPELKKGEDPTQEQWNFIYTQLDQNKRQQLLQYAQYLAEEQAKYEARPRRMDLAKDLPPVE